VQLVSSARQDVDQCESREMCCSTHSGKKEIGKKFGPDAAVPIYIMVTEPNIVFIPTVRYCVHICRFPLNKLLRWCITYLYNRFKKKNIYIRNRTEYAADRLSRTSITSDSVVCIKILCSNSVACAGYFIMNEGGLKINKCTAVISTRIGLEKLK